MALSRRHTAGLVLLLALAGCRQETPAPASTTSDHSKVEVRSLLLKDRRQSPQPLPGEDLRAELSLIETSEAGLNRQIERWVGSHCPRDPEQSAVPESGAACLKLWMDGCLKQATALAGTDTPVRCSFSAETKVVLNRDYLLSLALESYADTGGAHGMPSVSYLNIDRRNGKALALTDLIQIPDPQLRALLEQQLRLALNVPPQASLKASGFFEDRLPLTDNVALDNEGLRFTYSAYEIAPYSMGLPNIHLPYAALAEHLAPDSPIRRLLP